VTGYVDGELSPGLEHHVERHLYTCPICAAQSVFEINLRERLGRASTVPLPAGLPERILAAVRCESRFRAH